MWIVVREGGNAGLDAGGPAGGTLVEEGGDAAPGAGAAGLGSGVRASRVLSAPCMLFWTLSRVEEPGDRGSR
jgi:hypothetical protein